jgi:hypothetical protein
MACLLDQILGLARMPDSQRMPKHAFSRKPYRPPTGAEGKQVPSQQIPVSKEAVKDRLHSLEIPDEWEKPETKRVVDYLYVEADEDHVSLQFQKTKGDLEKNAAGRKNNALISKMVYVHEGIEPDAPKSRRHHLKNPRYFADVCGEGRTMLSGTGSTGIFVIPTMWIGSNGST